MGAKESGAATRASRSEPAGEDTAVRALEPEERSRLEMDAWEPSLLRCLLEAQGKLPRRPG